MAKKGKGRGAAIVLGVGLVIGGGVWVKGEVDAIHAAHDELWKFLQDRGALVAVGKLAADGCVAVNLPTFRLNGHHRNALDGSRGPIHNTVGLDSGGRNKGPKEPVYDMTLRKDAAGLARLMVGVDEEGDAPDAIHVSICSSNGTATLSDGSTRTSIEISFPLGTPRSDEVIWAENQPQASPSPAPAHS